MKRVLTILTLCLLLTGSSWAQCTITQPLITNASLVGGVANFSLSFKHNRNWGNKWITIHLWKSTDYPSYDYDRVPTTTRLGGSSKKPFGSIVINNANVSTSGSYSAAQAFVVSYQNDGTFFMLNTTGSTLVYNSVTDAYVLNGLQCTLPPGTTTIKFDSWSSQSSGNNNVHCYSLCGSILVPTVLPVTGLETFKAEKGSARVKFSWTTQSESNNSHFVIQELIGSEWKDMATVFSKFEDGNSSLSTRYEFSLDTSHKQYGYIGLWITLSFIGAVMFRRYVPARLSMLVCIVVVFACHSCKSSSSLDSLLQDRYYRLKQVDRDQQTVNYSPSRFVSI